MQRMTKSFWLSLLLSQLFFIIGLPLFIELVTYLHPAVIVVMWICVTSLTFFIVFFVRGETIVLSRPLFRGLLIMYTIGLFILLFFRPNDQDYSSWNIIPFQTIAFYFTGAVSPLVAFYNLAANIGLFVPHGIYLMQKNKEGSLHAWLLVILPSVAILGIETAQHLTNRGTFDIDDFILNMAGVLIGYWVYPLFTKVINLNKR
ncbi:VanZ family protein [Priestia koreensis]|uniref:VanZ family protein n=1 Tax=Priestia koreensis TaxID=284581 RepID=UPI0028F73E4B|nr:VanZ family protein [Priestia koreensis]